MRKSQVFFSTSTTHPREKELRKEEEKEKKSFFLLLLTRRENTSAIAVEFEIMHTALCTFARSPPGTTVGGW